MSDRRNVGEGAEPHLPPSAGAIRVLVAGRHRVVLESIAHLVGSEHDMEVVRAREDVAIVDLDEANDEMALARLAKTAARVRTIVLSSSLDPLVALRVFRAGARGLISKRQPLRVLLTAIRKVHGGEIWLGRALATQVLELARAERRSASRPRFVFPRTR